MIVLDASAIIEILLQTEAGAPVAERLLTPDSSLHAPHLLDIEVAQVLRRFVARGQVKEVRAYPSGSFHQWTEFLSTAGLTSMSTMGATRFKQQCLAILDRLEPEGIVITKIASTSIVHRVPLVTRDTEIRKSKLVPLAK